MLFKSEVYKVAVEREIASKLNDWLEENSLRYTREGWFSVPACDVYFYTIYFGEYAKIVIGAVNNEIFRLRQAK